MKKIAKELKRSVNEIFFDDEEDEEKVSSVDIESFNDESISHNICNYMNAMKKGRNYNLYEISIIRKSIRTESINRNFRSKLTGKKIDARTKIGKMIINKQIADMANKIIKDRRISVEDVELYKRCKLFEYENRTGQCSWGIPSARESLGFNPITGEENVE